MKKYACIFLIGLAIVIMGMSIAQAQGPAIVLTGEYEYCHILASDGTLFPTTGEKWIAVYSNDANGNSMISCRAWQPTDKPLPEKTMHFNYDNTGEECFTSWGYTKDWKNIVTPSGMAKLICHINPSLEE